jgi:hypothetical protein
MEDFILIIIMFYRVTRVLVQEKKTHVFDICTKSYANGLDAI